MTEFDYFTTYGAWIGLLLYIFVHDVIPFYKEKFWPAIREDNKEKQIFRRESDAKLLDLEERKIVADEQIAKTIILLVERIAQSEKASHEHDLRMANAFAQVTATLTGMQSVLTVLLDRVTRPVVTIQEVDKSKKGD